jgi:hypothetical protein
MPETKISLSSANTPIPFSKWTWPLFLICVIFFSGCAKLKYLDELLTLKAYSDEQDALDKEVERNDRSFEAILTAAQNGDLDDYKTAKSVLKKFGAPVLKKKEFSEGEEYDLWLYRYAVEYFDSPKVYLRFDKTGNTIDYEIIE